ncbi:MAG: sulfite exporter TauE/SafE family protein [Clostridia bacterium]|nr:sulfite exporter TauE/SafE family protein [Clostridia bacterium]
MLPLLIGFLSGIIGGMGVGGGMLLIPAAKIFMGLSQQSAQALNLYCFIPSSVCAIFVHLKNKKIEFKKALPVIITGVPFSLLGAYISTHISQTLLSRLFGGFILIFGIREVISGIKQKNS